MLDVDVRWVSVTHGGDFYRLVGDAIQRGTATGTVDHINRLSATPAVLAALALGGRAKFMYAVERHAIPIKKVRASHPLAGLSTGGHSPWSNCSSPV